jgi:hypothetical protein
MNKTITIGLIKFLLLRLLKGTLRNENILPLLNNKQNKDYTRKCILRNGQFTLNSSDRMSYVTITAVKVSMQ